MTFEISSQLPIEDLHVIADRFEEPPIPSERVLITGGSGFIGQWLIHSLSAIADIHRVSYEILIPTRRPELLENKIGRVSDRVQILPVPSESLVALDLSDVRYVAHLAANTTYQARPDHSETLRADTGVLQILKQRIEQAGICPSFLYASSGAVYGRPRISPIHPVEDAVTGLAEGVGHDEYSQAKLASESEVRLMTSIGLVRSTIARLYAFIGPLLPLDEHYAIGNFVRDAHMGHPVTVTGNGIDRRSWMYAGDLASSLLGLWKYSDNAALTVNVGSSEEFSILEAAHRIAEIAGVPVNHVVAAREETAPSFYVPNVSRLASMVNRSEFVNFSDAVRRHLDWLRRSS